jgi:tripartite-type tricarboxylate transporter receptor subunit TctC
LFVAAIATFSIVASQFHAAAQVNYPTRPVTIWVGFSAGGGTDIIIRALADASEKALGQKFVVMNKPGGGGSLAASLIAKEKPDGYTVTAFPDTPATRAPHLMDLDYDALQDLNYIIRVGLWKNAFVVRSDSPFKKWEDLVNWAKKNPDQLVYGHPGNGTSPHIAMAKVALKEGFKFKNVPFAGDTPTVSALLGGHVMCAGGSSLAWKSHVEAKTIRVLLVFEREGIDYAPEAPTFAKIGYNFETPTSVIVCGPKKLPDSIKNTLERAFMEGMKTESFKTVAKNQELLLTDPLTGKALNDYLRKCYFSYEQFIKEAGIYKSEKKK